MDRRTSNGPSMAVSSEEMVCSRCSKSFARVANFFLSVSLILQEVHRSMKIQNRVKHRVRTVSSVR